MILLIAAMNILIMLILPKIKMKKKIMKDVKSMIVLVENNSSSSK